MKSNRINDNPRGKCGFSKQDKNGYASATQKSGGIFPDNIINHPIPEPDKEISNSLVEFVEVPFSIFEKKRSFTNKKKILQIILAKW